MQPRKKSDSPVDSFTNDSTPSSSNFPVLDSPSTQEHSKDSLPTNGEVVPLIPEKASNKLKNKSKFGCLAGLTIFLLLGFGTVLLSLPSLVSCGSKVKQIEAKQNVGAMNRAQQAYYLEKKAFSNSFESLGLGLRTQTTNYVYSTRATKMAAFSYGISKKGTKDTKSYVGAVFVVPATNLDRKVDKKQMTTVDILCEAISPGNTRPTAPTLQKGVATCGSDTKDLTSRYK